MESLHQRQNQLLASLPDAEWQRLLPQLEEVDLPLGKVLYESGAQRTFVYFPTSAIISLLYLLDDGASTEVAVVGFEGLLGVCIFMGGGSMPIRAVVQNAGMGYRLRSDVFKDAFERSIHFRIPILRNAQALITQMGQTVVCNRHHSLDMRFSRWLLLCLDRLHSNEVVMTHEQIANNLGVRRESVTEAAQRLQTAGVIRYARGHIWVQNRPSLEERTCECYRVVKTEYDRLIPDYGMADSAGLNAH